MNSKTGRELDEYLSRLERFGFAGGALAVRGRDALLSKFSGLADPARRIPLSTDSVCNLGSITKQSTGAAILTLDGGGVERGCGLRLATGGPGWSSARRTRRSKR